MTLILPARLSDTSTPGLRVCLSHRLRDSSRLRDRHGLSIAFILPARLSDSSTPRIRVRLRLGDGFRVRSSRRSGSSFGEGDGLRFSDRLWFWLGFWLGFALVLPAGLADTSAPWVGFRFGDGFWLWSGGGSGHGVGFGGALVLEAGLADASASWFGFSGGDGDDTGGQEAECYESESHDGLGWLCVGKVFGEERVCVYIV
jgi:hypothetical protein